MLAFMAIESDQDRLFVESLFCKYHEKMYLIAMDILNNHHDAQDCVQDVFVKIIDKLEDFKRASENGYLIKLIVIVSRNTALNQFKRNQKKNQNESSTTVYDEDDDWSIADIPDFSANTEKIVLNRFVIEYVRELIDKLEIKYRDVVVLKGMGYSTDDISYFLNISKELVRKRYSRAKQMILEMGGKALYGYRD